MKIRKNANGDQIVKMSREEWEGLGKQAGWLKEANEEMSEEGGEDIVRECQPVEAPPRTKPKKRTRPGETKDPDANPGERRRRNPNPGVNPDPKGEKKEEVIAEACAEVDPENLPTIASELKRFQKRG